MKNLVKVSFLALSFAAVMTSCGDHNATESTGGDSTAVDTAVIAPVDTAAAPVDSAAAPVDSAAAPAH